MDRCLAISTLMRRAIRQLLDHRDPFVRRWARVADDHVALHGRDGHTGEDSTLSVALRVCAAGLLSVELDHPTLIELRTRHGG